MKHWKEIVIIFSVVLLYGNTINNGFVLDDFSAIVENRFVQSGTDGISEIFTSHYRKGYWSNPGDLYRPLVLTSFAIEHQFSDGGASFHHILNIVFYALLGLLLYWLTSNWFKNENKYLPLTITLLFLFHPIHTEVVANIKSRDELLSLLFVLSSLLCYSKYMKNKSVVSLVLVGVSFMLALLSKESSIVFIAIIPLTGWFFYDQKKNDLLKIIGVLVVPVITFLLLRSNALEDQNETVPVTISFLSDDPMNTFLLSGYHLMLYLYKLVFPFSLASQYAEFYAGASSTVLLFGGLGILFHGVLLFYGIKWILQKKIIGFAIIWYLITTILHSNLVLVIGTQFGERLLFTPSIAFCMLVGVYIFKLTKEKSEKVTVGVIGVLLLVYSFTVVQRNTEWESNAVLYAADVENQPESAMLNYWHSLELTNNKYLNTLSASNKTRALNDALDYLNAAIKLKPNYGDAEAQIGLVYYKLGRNDEALPYFKKSISTGKGNVSTLNNMAAIYFAKNDFENAKLYYEQAVTIDPYFKDAWGNLGITYAQLNDLVNAERVFLRAIELSPNNAQLYFYMGMTLNQMGKATEAVPFFEKAFVLDPSLNK